MIAYIFPGQGSQSVGMGRDVYEQSAAARAIFDQAQAVLGFDLAQLCFAGPENELTATQNAQPALLTVSVALLAAMREAGMNEQPAWTAGHSLGEYSALVAAGALEFADALRLVRRRGELMAQANEGTMAAVMGLELEPLQTICADVQDLGACVVANQNAPGQLVISGAVEAVQAASERAKAAGAKRVMPLNVSAAFHSPLMQAAAAGLAETVAITPINDAAIPVIANTTAQPIRTVAEIKHELVAQVTAPVRWIDTIQTLAQHGVTQVVEIGAGSVLTGLVKRIAPDVARRNIGKFEDIV